MVPSKQVPTQADEDHHDRVLTLVSEILLALIAATALALYVVEVATH
jgi:hypothetical protein